MKSGFIFNFFMSYQLRYRNVISGAEYISPGLWTPDGANSLAISFFAAIFSQRGSWVVVFEQVDGSASIIRYPVE